MKDLEKDYLYFIDNNLDRKYIIRLHQKPSELLIFDVSSLEEYVKIQNLDWAQGKRYIEGNLIEDYSKFIW